MNILNKYILGCLFVCFLQVAALYLTLELCPGAADSDSWDLGSCPCFSLQEEALDLQHVQAVGPVTWICFLVTLVILRFCTCFFNL